MKKLLLYGYYGKGNAGDDALAFVCIEQLWKMFGTRYSIEVLSDIPVCHESGALLSYPDFTRRFARLRSIISSNVIVFGGGGIFQDYRKSGLADLREKYFFVTLARLLGKKVVFLGVSVGPLVTDKGKRLTRKILKAVDLVTLRDDKSFRLVINDLGITGNVEKTFDLAVLMGDYAKKWRICHGTKTIGVSIMPVCRSNLIIDQKKLNANLSLVLARLIDHQGFQVKLIELNRNDGDGDVMADLARLIDRPGFVTSVPYTDHPGEMAKLVGQCSHFLAMRLHSAIFSYMCGIPFALINYHDKCEGFANEIGLAPERLIYSADEAEVSSKIDLLINTDSQRYTYPLEGAKKAALRSFRQLGCLLKDRDIGHGC